MCNQTNTTCLVSFDFVLLSFRPLLDFDCLFVCLVFSLSKYLTLLGNGWNMGGSFMCLVLSVNDQHVVARAWADGLMADGLMAG